MLARAGNPLTAPVLSDAWLSKRPHLALMLLGLPVLLIAIFYTPSLRFAYRLDDLAWLSLRNTLMHGRSLWWALFSPQAQGTIRPLGERTWFLLAASLFGLNPVPFHLLALFTQIVNVCLLIVAGRRLFGSLTPAAIAATLWIINDSLVEPMVWASAFNEVLYMFWFLLAFIAFFRWMDSGKSLWLAVHLLAIVLGLGTLELMVTFPVVVAAYVALFAPKCWKMILPSAVLAVAFVAAHLAVVRIPQSGPYRLIFGWGMVGELIRYWEAVLGPAEFGHIYQISPMLTRFGTILMSTAVAWWLTHTIRRRQWICLFGLLWFIICLAPTLPLRRHFTGYYAFVPLVGLAWLAADALVRIRSWPGKSIALVCIGLYVLCEIPCTRFVRNWHAEQSRDVERREAQLARAVEDVRRTQPGGAIFLYRLDTEQFWWVCAMARSSAAASPACTS